MGPKTGKLFFVIQMRLAVVLQCVLHTFISVTRRYEFQLLVDGLLPIISPVIETYILIPSRRSGIQAGMAVAVRWP